jgi:ethanolamine utilization protein EutA
VSSAAGGRIFFSSSGRTLAEEDRISILTSGVDIGSSTSHLVFSRIVLERLDSRYVIVSRETLYESDILLTPYAEGDTIDAAALGRFIDRQYRSAGIDPGKIDTGALILTGVAVERSNARAIGDLFAREAGKMVAVTAGDRLEAVMACHGSGAVARSLREQLAVLNIDIGGGTTKVGLCLDGRVVGQACLDAGARLICFDGRGRIVRIEAAARLYAAEAWCQLQIGGELDAACRQSMAEMMADRIIAAASGQSPSAGGASLLRTEPLEAIAAPQRVIVSGGVAEYFYGRERNWFGDLGRELAAAMRARLEAEGIAIEQPDQAIRATVVGASQYTSQVSGSTIYVSPMSVLPLRNVPVIAPDLGIESEPVDSSRVVSAIRRARARLDLTNADKPVAIFAPWRGSATFDRLDAFCRGIAEALKDVIARGNPVVLAGDGDVGGLIGAHFHHELNLDCPIVSIDSLDLREFDYIDVGEILQYSGAVPVIIKSLVFPGRHEFRKPV